MEYLAIHCKVKPTQPFAEILISQLGEIGFDMFEENDAGFSGFIIKDNFDSEKLKTIEYFQPNDFCETEYVIEEIKPINWNEEWEKNFEPVFVKTVYIRAPFHPAKANAELEIIIQPKMSFGTGHHATTAMMVENMLSIDFKNKTVLDMGCGSGILGILASKLGAKNILAIDNDANCIVNSNENTAVNKISNMQVMQGDATLLVGLSFDIILANINRNILVNDICYYAKAMYSESVLIVSGFYEIDEEVIKGAFAKHQLKKIKKLVKDNWCCIVFKR